MTSLWIGLRRLALGFRLGMSDPEFRAIVFLLGVAIVIGAIFFHFEEGWSWLDSAYFSVVAMTTVGDATLSPSTGLSKIFTMAYSLAGIGLMLVFLARLSTFRDEVEENEKWHK